jgi:hypothetical protein
MENTDVPHALTRRRDPKRTKGSMCGVGPDVLAGLDGEHAVAGRVA